MTVTNAINRRKQTRLLLPIIAPMLVVVVMMLSLSIVSMGTLSATGSYIAGESAWSKAERDAVAYLQAYVRSADEAQWQSFRRELLVPLGDRMARQTLLGPRPDIALATRGFLAGRNAREDIPGMIRLLLRFHAVPVFRKATDIWAQADIHILALSALGDRVRTAHAAGRVQTEAALREIADLHAKVAPLEAEFSVAIIDASRQLRIVLYALLGLCSALLIAIGTWICRRLLQRSDVMADALRATQSYAQTQQDRADVTLRSIADAVLSADSSGRIDYMNAAAERLTGWSLAEARDRAWEEVCHLANGLLIRRDGTTLAVQEHAATIRDREGQEGGLVLVLRDVTLEREFAAQLSHQATHDSLTGLVNRREFERRLQATLQAPVTRGINHALLYFDLDQFKVVNDTCGHAAGDALIKRVAAVTQGLLRDRDTLARLGGDEFGVLVMNCSTETAQDIAESIRCAIAELRFVWEGHSHAASASIGLAMIGAVRQTLADVLSAVDQACYAAKEAGRNRVQLWKLDDRELNARQGEMEWVSRINAALETNRFVLHAQRLRPAASPHDWCAVEVLVRMQDSQGGLIAPMAFIPAAERYSLMARVDRWVVLEVIRELALLQSTGAALPQCLVNLSAAALNEPDFADFMLGALHQAGIAADRLGLEISETAAITHLQKAGALMARMKQAGCSIVLDEFGSGMSAFDCLRNLPLDHLKISGNLVAQLTHDPLVHAMVESIQRVGSVIGVSTIAARVEDEATLQQLIAIGVSHAQGYALHRPEHLHDVLRLCASQQQASEMTKARKTGPLRLIS